MIIWPLMSQQVCALTHLTKEKSGCEVSLVVNRSFLLQQEIVQYKIKRISDPLFMFYPNLRNALSVAIQWRIEVFRIDRGEDHTWSSPVVRDITLTGTGVLLPEMGTTPSPVKEYTVSPKSYAFAKSSFVRVSNPPRFMSKHTLRFIFFISISPCYTFKLVWSMFRA